MKRLAVLGGLTVVLTVLLAGCASAPDDQVDQAQVLDEHPFDYYFPDEYFVKTFATIDEAFSYVTAAKASFGKAVRKREVQGLAAKLVGPAIEGDQPVTVYCFLTAGDRSSDIDLSKVKGDLAEELQKAITVANVFLVFYQDRSVSISSFHLAPGYRYTTNAQYPGFHVNETDYKADYPVGWGASTAFRYLRHEID